MMTTTRNHSLCYLLALAVLFAVVLPAINTHAVARHANDAITAYNFVRDNGEPGNRHDCEDGRTRWICEMGQGRNGKQLCAVVVVAGVSLVTAFVCRKRYADNIVGDRRD